MNAGSFWKAALLLGAALGASVMLNRMINFTEGEWSEETVEEKPEGEPPEETKAGANDDGA